MQVSVRLDFVNRLMEASNSYRWGIAHGNASDGSHFAKRCGVECSADLWDDDVPNAITTAVIWYGTFVQGREIDSGLPVLEAAWNLHLFQTRPADAA